MVLGHSQHFLKFKIFCVLTFSTAKLNEVFLSVDRAAATQCFCCRIAMEIHGHVQVFQRSKIQYGVHFGGLSFGTKAASPLNLLLEYQRQLN